MTDWLSKPQRIWKIDELFLHPDTPPPKPGLYGWYFKTLPEGVPVDGCFHFDGFVLGYVGIAPSRKPSPGVRGPTLRSRIRKHCTRNASVSTLRLTLGSLLGLTLQETGPTKRLTFGADEATVSAWIKEHARIVWVEHPSPWEVEQTIIKEFSPPLNLKDNPDNAFAATLSLARKNARDQLRSGKD
jgi:hypothetical protein